MVLLTPKMYPQSSQKENETLSNSQQNCYVSSVVPKERIWNSTGRVQAWQSAHTVLKKKINSFKRKCWLTVALIISTNQSHKTTSVKIVEDTHTAVKQCVYVCSKWLYVSLEKKEIPTAKPYPVSLPRSLKSTSQTEKRIIQLNASAQETKIDKETEKKTESDQVGWICNCCFNSIMMLVLSICLGRRKWTHVRHQVSQGCEKTHAEQVQPQEQESPS